MEKTALIIDNSSYLSKEEIKKLNVLDIIPISFIINGEEYSEEKNMTYEEFYQFLSNKNTDVSTCQPSAEAVREGWRTALKNHDDVIHIPLSSGLSEACNTAINVSREAEFKGKVFVADNQRVAFMHKIAVYEARHMIKEGKSAKEIKDYLEKHKGECGIYVAVDTLKFLKKGGRVTPAAAAIGTLLKIKPILSVHGGKLDAYAKAITMRQAKKKLIAATKKEVDELFSDELKQGKVRLGIIHSNPDMNAKEVKNFEQEIREALPEIDIFTVDPLPLFIACHTGPNSLGMGFVVDRMDVLK